MKPVWQIDGNDIIGLQGRSPDLLRVVNGLLARQASGVVPDAAVHLNIKDTEPDGGVDAAVDTPVPGDSTGYLGFPTCWQYKAQSKGNIRPKMGGGQEAALREEIGKPYARDLVKKGYAYRFCIADDMPVQKKKEWEGWLTDEARKINPNALPALVVTASDLAQWANRYPAVVAGEFRPYLGNILSLDDWHRDFRAVTPEFVASSAWAATAEAVRRHIDFTKPASAILTVQGEAGVGKSRSVCEALLGDPARDALVAVTSDERLALEFARVVAKDRQTRAILVADECSIDYRVDLARIVEPCPDRLRVVVIDNSLQREGGAGEIRLVHLASFEVDKVLERNFPGLPADRRRAYSDLARGFVRLAVDLCRRDDLVPTDGRIDSVFGFFHDTYLRRRLRPEELDAVELVSLLPRVGYRDDVKSELERLCALTLVGLRASDVVRVANRLKQAPGFIAFAGRYLYVTPALIGQVAFQGAWERWISPDPAGFLSALPEPFIATIMQRVQSAGTDVMRRTVSDFFLDWVANLGPPGLGSEKTVLRIVRLVEVRPEFVLPVLRGLLESTTIDELRQLHSGTLEGKQARRQLVWLAEKLTHFHETFADTEAMLLRLALAETESNLGNSASRLWAALFRVVLSGTPVPFSDRLALLERRLRTADAAQLALALTGLDEILTDGPVSRLASPPVLFGRIPPTEWRPASQAERKECRSRAMAMAMRVKACGGAVADGIRGIVARRLTTLLLAGFLNEVRDIVGPPPLPDALLTEIVRELEEFLEIFCREHDIDIHSSGGATSGPKFDLTGEGVTQRSLSRAASVELEARVREWYRSLIPGDLHSRVVSMIGQDYWHQQLNGDHEAWQKAMDGLAAELVRSPDDFQRELDWLCSPDARSAFHFGQALAQADRGPVLLERMLWEIPRAKGTVLARGYLERITACRPDLLARVNNLLDRLQGEDPKVVFDILWSAGDEVRKVDRLFTMVDRGELGPELLRGLEHGVRDRQLREDELLGAIDRLLRATQAGNERAASAAIHLLYGWVRPVSGAPGGGSPTRP